jgi:signal transduction histidine kinase
MTHATSNLIYPIVLIALANAPLSCLHAKEAVANTDQQRRMIQEELETLPKLVPSLQTYQRIGFHGHGTDSAWVMIDLGREVMPEKIVLFPARPAVASDPPSIGFPSSLEIRISSDTDFSTSELIARWQEASPGDGEQIEFLVFGGNRARGRYLRIYVDGFRIDPLHPGESYYRLGEVVVLQNDQNVALRRRVTSTASTELARRWESMNLTDGYLWCLPLRGSELSPTNGYHSGIIDRAVVSEQVWVEVDLESVQPIDEVHFVPAYPLGFADQPGFGFPTHFRIMADAESENEKVLLDESLPEWPAEALPNPGASQLMLATPGLQARRIRISCEALWTNSVSGDYSPREFLLAISELQVWREGKNLALGQPVAAASSLDAPRWNSAALTDGYSSREKLLNWADWLSGIERAQQLREQLAEVDLSIRVKQEVVRLRVLWGAIGSTVVASFLGLTGMLWLRARAKRSVNELRTRIAQDLHDEIGASLSQLAIQSDLAKQHLLRGSLAPKRLEAISKDARQTLDQMRDVIWLLTPQASSWSDFSHRLEAIANRMLHDVGHDVLVEGEPPQGRPSIEWVRNVLMFLKESLTNARRHSDAECIRVVFVWNNRLVLHVEDNGRGFDVSNAREAGGSGLLNLEQRAATLTGSLDIKSSPDSGTKIILSIPYSHDRRIR